MICLFKSLCNKIFITDTIPAPENVTLDTGDRILHWNPILQPSDLPPDFELVHNYNITYLVHMYDKDDVDTATSVTVPVDRNYLNLDDESIDINICKEQEFVVQAVVDNSHSDNSSAVSGIFTDGECYILILLHQFNPALFYVYSSCFHKFLSTFTVTDFGECLCYTSELLITISSLGLRAVPSLSGRRHIYLYNYNYVCIR